jgi:hypothetical protein
MVHASRWLLTNRMNELFTSGSVGGAAGNRCLYPARDLAKCDQKRVADGVLRKVGPVVFRCSYPGVHCR